MNRDEAIAEADALVDTCLDKSNTLHGVLSDAQLAAIAYLSWLADTITPPPTPPPRHMDSKTYQDALRGAWGIGKRQEGHQLKERG